MNPQKQAQEIIDNIIDAPVNILVSGEPLHFEVAKEIALIAIRYIINSNPHCNPLNSNELVSTMDYWLEVAEEVEEMES